MNLNDTITIYHKDLSMEVHSGVYWHGVSGLATSGHGKSVGFAFEVLVPYAINVELGDICVRGRGVPIASKSDLPRYDIFTIEHIKDNIRGTRLDYIAFNGN